VSIFNRFLILPALALAIPCRAGILWDNWYTVTERNSPHSYYNEKAEISGERVKIQLNTFIRDGRKIRSENIGAAAKNTLLLEPLFYNYRTQVNGEEKVIDGTVDPRGKVFTVKSRTGVISSKPLKAEMIPNLILASLFPVWVHKNYKKISGVQPKAFQAILEDQVEGEVPVIRGSAYEMRADEFANSTQSRKLRVEFAKVVSFWWVTRTGDALKIEVPTLERVVKKTTRENAEHFLAP
jgi:hypothetical protein